MANIQDDTRPTWGSQRSPPPSDQDEALTPKRQPREMVHCCETLVVASSIFCSSCCSVNRCMSFEADAFVSNVMSFSSAESTWTWHGYQWHTVMVDSHHILPLECQTHRDPSIACAWLPLHLSQYTRMVDDPRLWRGLPSPPCRARNWGG